MTIKTVSTSSSGSGGDRGLPTSGRWWPAKTSADSASAAIWPCRASRWSTGSHLIMYPPWPVIGQFARITRMARARLVSFRCHHTWSGSRHRFPLVMRSAQRAPFNFSIYAWTASGDENNRIHLTETHCAVPYPRQIKNFI